MWLLRIFEREEKFKETLQALKQQVFTESAQKPIQSVVCCLSLHRQAEVLSSPKTSPLGI